MIAVGPPPALWTPAIIRAHEPWEQDADAELARHGVPSKIRRAVLAEIKRLTGLRPSILQPRLDDLSRYAGVGAQVLPGIGAVAGLFKPASAPAVKAITYVGTSTLVASGGNPVSYASQSLGAGAIGRRIIVAALAQGGSVTNAPGGLTVAGNAATALTPPGFNVSTHVRLFIITDASNTTATIEVTYGGSGNAAHRLIIWSAVGLTSNTAVDTATSTAASPTSGVMTTLAGGFMVGAAISNANVTHTWTGLTENVDNGAAGLSSTGASGTTAGTTNTATATPTGTSRNAGAFASL